MGIDSSWTPERLGSLARKTFVITGANSGIGFEAARLLLAKGARVVMLNRSPERSAAAIEALRREFGPKARVSFILMDLGSLASVRQGAAELLERTPRIDAFIGNAAIAQVARRTLTADGFEKQFAVNYLSYFVLSGLLAERIEASSGRFVFVSSMGYRMGLRRIRFEDLHFEQKYNPWDAYAQSKLALMLFAYELQRRLQENKRRLPVYVCHPGATRGTRLLKEASPGMRMLWRLLSLLAQPTPKGAWPLVMCATESELEQKAFYGPTKWGCTVGPVGTCPLDPIALDREAAARLWELSEAITGFRWPL
ncbi:MAG: SDR family oxidoreductase [Zetaproteobacteria bacterium]|nr:MAG: SDR family oxidoreductase [Zetaproteobacteria bacterium]